MTDDVRLRATTSHLCDAHTCMAMRWEVQTHQLAPSVSHSFLGLHPSSLPLQLRDAGCTNKGLIVCMDRIYAESPESQLCPIRVPQQESFVFILSPQTKAQQWCKNERKKTPRERYNNVIDGKYEQSESVHINPCVPQTSVQECNMSALTGWNALAHAAGSGPGGIMFPSYLTPPRLFVSPC